MTSSVHGELNSTELRIRCAKDMGVEQVGSFRQAYNSHALPEGVRIMVDLKQTESFSSALLGMLLNMRDHIPDVHPILLVNCSEALLKAFSVTKLDLLFSVSAGHIFELADTLASEMTVD